MSLPNELLPVGLLGTGAAAEGYAIERSVRFNSADSAYLSRTPASAGNRNTWTWAGWMKLATIADNFGCFFDAGTGSVNNNFRIHPEGDITFRQFNGSTLDVVLATTQLFRDYSAWYHLVLTYDSSNATSSDRVRLYVNGERITAFANATYPSSNLDSYVNSTNEHRIGTSVNNSSTRRFDGYLADIHFIDGQALDPTSFGEFDADTGIWNPKAASISSPNNGTTWSSVTTASPGINGSYPITNLFDSSTSTDAITSNSSGTGTITFSPTTAIPYTNSVEVYITTGGANVSASLNGGAGVLLSNGSGWNTVTTGSGSISSLVLTRTNGAVAASAIRVDGIILVDGATAYGTNGFHLPFSDNSTAAALGTDSAGSNDWTVNNISVTGILNYSSNVTTVATSIYNGTPATMFDGSTSTYYGVTSSSGNSSISIDLTGKNVNASTTIRVYGTYRNGMVWQINGSTVSSSGVTHPNTGWQTLTGWSAGAITSISTNVPAGSANEIYAIEIDGSILINSTGAGNDSLVDVPTNGSQTDTGVGGEVRGNHCTFNPIAPSGMSNATLANGNLDISGTGANYTGNVGTIALSSGKYYWEYTVTATGDASGVGIIATGSLSGAVGPGYGFAQVSDAWIRLGTVVNSNSTNAVTGLSSIGANDVVNVAVDIDAGKLWFGRNGTWESSGAPASGTNATVTFTPGGKSFYPCAQGVGTWSGVFNAGARSFAYTAPSGFKALNTASLPAPVITKPSEYMDVKLYTGNGTSQTISGLDFSPDFVWIKQRNTSRAHSLVDQVRGATKELFSDYTDAELTTPQALNAFTSDGFTVGSENRVNTNTGTYVAWTWDAGSSTVTNTDGSITSSVRANPSAGFSIVSWTGTGANGTIGHGLGVTPSLIICKNRGQSVSSWDTFHSFIGNTGALRLNSTSGTITASDFWNNTSPTSTVFSVSTSGSNNASGQGIIAYCFAPVAGYSSMGSYVGNGSADGPFVYTGFRPRWILIKNTSTSSYWNLWDAARNVSNPTDYSLYPNASDAEGSGSGLYIDIVSNGFKIRVGSATHINGSGNTIVFAAFAESPFQYARAR